MVSRQLTFSNFKVQTDPHISATGALEEARARATRKYFGFLGTYRRWMFPTAALDLEIDQLITNESLTTSGLISLILIPSAEESLTRESLTVSNAELGWVEANFAELQVAFGGQWIAVLGETVVAHGTKLADVKDQAAEQGIADPFMEWIPPQGDEVPILAV